MKVTVAGLLVLALAGVVNATDSAGPGANPQAADLGQIERQIDTRMRAYDKWYDERLANLMKVKTKATERRFDELEKARPELTDLVPTAQTVLASDRQSEAAFQAMRLVIEDALQNRAAPISGGLLEGIRQDLLGYHADKRRVLAALDHVQDDLDRKTWEETSGMEQTPPDKLQPLVDKRNQLFARHYATLRQLFERTKNAEVKGYTAVVLLYWAVEAILPDWKLEEKERATLSREADEYVDLVRTRYGTLPISGIWGFGDYPVRRMVGHKFLRDYVEMLERARQVGVGSVPKDVDLPKVEGGVAHLSDYRGRVVVVDFWATWCGPCVEKRPYLTALKHRLGTNFEVLSVSADDAPSIVTAFLKKKKDTLGPEFIVGRDGAMLLSWGVSGYLTYVVLDASGTVRAVGHSTLFSDKFEAFLGRLVAAAAGHRAPT